MRKLTPVQIAAFDRRFMANCLIDPVGDPFDRESVKDLIAEKFRLRDQVEELQRVQVRFISERNMWRRSALTSWGLLAASVAAALFLTAVLGTVLFGR